ncbi:AGE family epimerase/isomerase [Pseudalkalibacillus sp. A8]|uniref:AGE family epimerase/isomerase n=1 Tax=Pseudalkalibacillus sp. A8 TaxID=3382641 RepID=UPI0038B646E8
MVDEKEISQQMIQHIENQLLPFWRKSMDDHYGGVYTCYTNDGAKRISNDKFIWSQGRYLWIESRICKMMQAGILKDDTQFFLDHAKKTYEFIKEHALLKNGNYVYLLTESGEKKEDVKGRGYDSSIYADCFVCLGYKEYASLTGDRVILQQAIDLFRHISDGIMAGNFKSDPYPIPKGFSSHSVHMILLNVAQEIAETAEVLGHPDKSGLQVETLTLVKIILEKFRLSNGRIIEMLAKETKKQKTLLSRHVNPGHALESMWFIIHSARKVNDTNSINKAVDSILYALELGWDTEHDGLFRFVDYLGGKPIGDEIGTLYEKLIKDTWDTKLWWPHSEALYASILGYKMTGDPNMEKWFHRLRKYVFRAFPNNEQSIGEWIQIRDRKGQPINKVVALPVKDPFHILRNLILIIELLGEKKNCF